MLACNKFTCYTQLSKKQSIILKIIKSRTKREIFVIERNAVKKNDASETRTIKKYPNRRLYDTKISSYITLQDIKELVMTQNDFKVIDAKTKEDLTRCTLMQLIAEEETNGNPILTAEVLKEFVRFYGDSMQAMMSRFLEHSVKLFMENRASLKSPLNSMLGTNQTSQMQTIAEQTIHTFDKKDSDFINTNLIEEEIL
jgi:polyhydroxyalkanoate synthesis repressor PhaR